MGPSNDPEKEFEFSFLRDKDIGGDQDNHERHWFPVGNVLRFGEMQEPFEYCIDRGLTEGGLKFPYQTLMKLWKVVHEDRVIHYFLEEEQNLDKVLNIFIRVNSGGTELSYSDLLLSIAIAQWRELDAREEIYGLVDELNSVGEGFDFSKDFVLKACLVLSDTQQIEFRVDSFNRENMVRVENEWPDISRSIKLAVNLASSWGFSRQTLVSANALIPLAYYVHKQGHPPGLLLSSRWEETREQMRKWLMVVLLKRTFSGHTDTVLRSIRRAIQEDLDGFPINRISEELAGTSKSLTFDDAEVEGLLGYQYSQSYTFSVLALLYPWLKYDQQFHIDHVYPRSMFTERRLSEAGIPEERWPAWLEHTNDLANLQLLQGLPNQEKSDQAFEQWLEDECREPFERQEYLKLHMIPEVDLRFENFPEFCEARERMIRKRLEEIVAM